MPSCEICGNEPTRCVCSNYGRNAGPLCFQKEGWLRKTCTEQEAGAVQREGKEDHSIFAQILLVIAFLMVFTGVILLSISGTTGSQSGFVLIFQFFLASGGSSFIILPALAIIALMIILTLISTRRNQRN